MDIRKIKKLIELLEESDIGELEIKEGEESVRISRGVSGAPQAAPVYAAPAAPAAAPAPTPAPAAAETQEEAPAITGHVVKSPMVGTFYAAPSPGAEPFVKVGQQVKVGDVICIVEAMKMMNQIEADKAGTIEAILVENGQPVEFDQPLVTIV
ncbi:acetyl-CoA carboxylase biotin carboxyl carrier protein [Microbulbifer thermotolerans]|uniref:Biotin carboxyl carrier protein of acetyl-CoA carboxylase n=1 Tax=Microbulbifer thermotolerans TaxID=252514 RepID=A0A143HJU3_MICTH|nr:acetyl-CoA carboxylase biotin carboxyl carrier protein [Microbulbifer thermotolerans]AMX01542.1 acetyl-CoA carboxylase biotin carboxyl carrier protein subunit [Microbulbifer thermotolerans]MCX2778395.1 acetyl-CoA carboxylase biotin carboxyl carrier protein [Microbulbifer thermotolerans]MCX2784187.1 acetyl-CoA carboxylase biotin carboxyl carrier protein [Microbulbifer thermotolerans]MCX2796164.1 acetyl-CoA carboxylase biotin carboxyl carrier protein [Microbulbifer thermotolerans]MCX2803031.1